jgi:hypothetical protein
MHGKMLKTISSLKLLVPGCLDSLKNNEAANLKCEMKLIAVGHI